MLNVINKFADEDIVITWEFLTCPEISAGQDIESATVTSSALGLTLGSTVINGDGNKVQHSVSGGAEGQRFTLTMVCETDGGRTIAEQAEIAIL